MKRVMVTGGLGFIGSYFIELALEKGYYIVNIDKKTYAARTDLDFDSNPNYELVEKDICELEHLPVNIDYIINFAAESHVDNSITANKIFLDSNIYGVYNLLELVRAKGVDDRPIFLHISTDEVYGDITEGSCTEESTTFASNPYSATKAAAEQLIFAWGRTYDIKYMITRSSNNYGFGQYPEKLIPKTFEFSQKNKKMTIHGSGEYTREWIYAKDNCEGILTVMEKGEIGEIYNISSDVHYTNLDIVKKVLKVVGLPEDYYVHVENRLGQDTRYSIDSSKVKKLGWQPKTSLDDYLVEYYKLHK